MPGESGSPDGPERRVRNDRDPPTDPDFQIPVLPPNPPPSRRPWLRSRIAAWPGWRSETPPPPQRSSLTPAALRARVQQHAQRRRWRYIVARRGIVATLASLVFLTTAAGWGLLTWANDKFRQISALDPGSSDIRDAMGQRGDENFLIVGSDTRAGAQAGDRVGTTNQVGGARSDTIMIAHLPADRNRAVIVSFPRDLEINRPPCERWDDTTGTYIGEIDPGATKVKINTAYEVGGPRCVTRVVQQISGLAVNHFVGVDFQGFKAMVDAVDGVRVCVERPVNDAVLGPIIPRPGRSVINGDTALRLVRARHVQGDPTGDYGRIVRQQRFLSALLRKTLSNKVLLHPNRLRGLVQALAANTYGQNADVGILLDLAGSLDGLDASQVTFVTVPTSGTNARGNEELRRSDTMAVFLAIINGTPLPGEAGTELRAVGAAPPQAPRPPGSSSPRPPPLREPSIPPHQVQLEIHARPHSAPVVAETRRDLRALGYDVIDADYVDEPGQRGQPMLQTLIRYPPGLDAAAVTLHGSIPSAVLLPDPALDGALVLEVGPNIGPVAPPAVAPPLPSDLTTINAADPRCT